MKKRTLKKIIKHYQKMEAIKRKLKIAILEMQLEAIHCRFNR